MSGVLPSGFVGAIHFQVPVMLAAVAADAALLGSFAGDEAVPDEPFCLPQPTKKRVAAVTMLMVCIFTKCNAA